MNIVVLLKSRMESTTTPCDPKRYVEKKHLCSLCGYRSISSWNFKRHYQACRKRYEKYNLNHKEDYRTIEAPAPTRVEIREESRTQIPTREESRTQIRKRFREESPTREESRTQIPKRFREESPTREESRTQIPKRFREESRTQILTREESPTREESRTQIPTRKESSAPTRAPKRFRVEQSAPTQIPKRFREESSASTQIPKRFRVESPTRKESRTQIPTRKESSAPKRFREERVESVFLGKQLENNPIGSPIDCRIIENFKMYISGPSRCGKSIFITSLLKNKEIFMKKCPEVICFVYSVYQEEIYNQLRDGVVNYFIEDDDQLERNIQRIVEENKGKSTLIIYDDLINSNNLSFIAKQFTVTGRHSGMSQVFVSQKLFPKNENIRLISNNSDYLVIFKNPRNATEIRILSHQMSKNVLSKIFHEATLEPYSYLFIDLTQECIPQKRYLSHLFNSDNYIFTYIEN